MQLEAQIQTTPSTGSISRGIELRVLTVNDAGDRVGRALAPYESDDGEMSRDDRQRWAAWGLRWVVVPIDQLDSVLGSQVLTQAAQNRWMGEFPQWRPMIRTGEIRNRALRIGLDEHFAKRTLNGRPRLLGRAWVMPEVSDSGVETRLRLDLAVQMTTTQTGRRWETPKLRTTLDDGPMIDELIMSQVLGSSSALILVGEDPAIDWDSEEGAMSIQPADASLGPVVPSIRTLGQQMLSTPGTGYVSPGVRYVPPKKVLIVLVPRVEGAYRLLGPTSVKGSQP